MRVLIIGGTGSFTSRVTELAVQRGHEVLVVARGRRQLVNDLPVRMLYAERGALRAHASAFAEFAPEVVVDSICFEAAHAEDLVALFPSARRVILISTVDVYGEDIGGMAVTEERALNPVTPYAQGKAACERIALDGLGRSATVFRPGHILGRTFLTTSLWGRSPYLVDRLRKGKTIAAIDGGRNLMTPVYAVDAANWVVESFSRREADGQIFNAVGAETVTQREYYECIAEILGVEAKIVSVPSPVFRRCFPSPSQFSWHRPYSSAKAVSLLGYRHVGTLRLMQEETVNYMLGHNLVRDCAEQPFDDALVALAMRHEDELSALLASKAAAAL